MRSTGGTQGREIGTSLRPRVKGRMGQELSSVLRPRRPRMAPERGTARETPPQVPATPEPGPEAGVFEVRTGHQIVTRGGLGVPHFLQTDEAWSGRLLGETATIGDAGSAIVCVAMVLAFYGRDVDPAVLDEWLDSEGGYLGDTVRFDVALACRQDDQTAELSMVQEVTADAEGEEFLLTMLAERVFAGAPTILQVSRSGDRSLHHVVVVGLDDQGRPLINDPSNPSANGSENPEDAEAGLFTATAGYRIEKLIPHAHDEDG